MPSMEPDVWRADVEWTRSRLPKEKILCVSVVASIQPGWTEDEFADDFARCAGWAVASGADCVETNFSCPNVSTKDGQLYQRPAMAARVAHRVRDAIGSTPYLIKIGFVDDDRQAADLIESLAPCADALVMTNAIVATVCEPESGAPLFDGQPRGIGGEAIRAASVEQVRRFAALARQRGLSTRMIGVGGISQASHVRDYLAAGAETVQLATAAMVDPSVACRIRLDW
jgi:dihydroorotate dehydrogenase